MCFLLHFSCIWVHVYAFAIKCMVNCGSASARRFWASLLLHTICVRSCCTWRASTQGSSMESTTKLSRYLIDDQRLTVILRRWIDSRCWYRPYSPVVFGLSRRWIEGQCHYRPWQIDWSLNWWIGVHIWMRVWTISHHIWDHDFLVDGCPGPFLTTFGTTGQWSFFDFSEKHGRAQRQRWNVTQRQRCQEEAKGQLCARLAVSVRNHWRRLRRRWSLVPAIGPFYSARTVGSPALACSALDEKSCWEAESLLARVVLALRGRLSTATIFWSLCPLRRSISTVNQFVFGVSPHQLSISTDFFKYGLYQP